VFEFRDDFLMGPKANLENGEGGQFLCSASSSAEDQLAQLADLVGSGSTLKTAGSSKPVELVDSAPALEFDLEDELSKAFVAPSAPVEPVPAQHEVFDTQALEAALQQPVAEPAPLVVEEPPVAAVETVDVPVDPSMEFSDMIADELDRALAEELADEVAADAAVEQAAHTNEPELVEVIDAAPE